MPDEILKDLDDGQLQAILIHKTAHLARRDTWVSLAQRIAVVLFGGTCSSTAFAIRLQTSAKTFVTTTSAGLSGIHRVLPRR